MKYLGVLRYVPGVAHMTKNPVKTHTLLERQLEARQDMREHFKWHGAFTYMKATG